MCRGPPCGSRWRSRSWCSGTCSWTPAARPAEPAPRAALLACSVAAACLALTFYPLLKGYTLGQIQVWVDALFALVVWAWLRGWQVTAGAALGLACLIKPPLAPVALWAVVVVNGALRLASPPRAPSAWRCRSRPMESRRTCPIRGSWTFIAARGEAYYPNQSFNGLLNRWFHNGDSLVFEDHAFSPPHPIVAAGTTIAAVMLLGLAFLLPLIRPHRDRRLDLPILALTATVISPIAWEHHYGVALPLFAVVLPVSLGAAGHGPLDGRGARRVVPPARSVPATRRISRGDGAESAAVLRALRCAAAARGGLCGRDARGAGARA